MIKFSTLVFFTFLSFATSASVAEKRINELLDKNNLKGGVYFKDLQTGNTISIAEDSIFPMASVFKLPIALVILHQIDKGALSLDKKINVTREDSIGGIIGPIAKKLTLGNIKLSVQELLTLMISNSDNTACDILIRLAGGPSKITGTLKSLGLKDINISRTERQIIEGKRKLIFNTASPKGLGRLYERLDKNRLLKLESKELLLELMTNAKTPPHIRKGLSSSYLTSNKSGWCGKPCVNDTAIVTNISSDKSYVIIVLLKGVNNFKKSSNLIAKITEIGIKQLTKVQSN